MPPGGLVALQTIIQQVSIDAPGPMRTRVGFVLTSRVLGTERLEPRFVRDLHLHFGERGTRPGREQALKFRHQGCPSEACRAFASATSRARAASAERASGRVR